jgi:tetratricopeptide (TPR) repeat protein
MTRAQKFAAAARNLAERTGGEAALPVALFCQAAVHYDSGNYQQSLELALLGLDRVDRRVDAGTYIRLNTMASFGFTVLRSYVDAEIYARRGLDFAQSTGSPDAIALAEQGLAALYEQCGNFVEAICCCERGLPFATQANRPVLVASLYGNRVISMRQRAVAMWKDEPHGAIEELNRVLDSALAAEAFAVQCGANQMISPMRSEIARVQFHLGLLDQAMASARQARDIAQSQNQAPRVGPAWLVEAWVHDATGEPDEAEHCFNEALTCAQSIHETKLVLEVLASMIEHYKRRGLALRALECAEALKKQYESDTQNHLSALIELTRNRRPD